MFSVVHDRQNRGHGFCTRKRCPLTSLYVENRNNPTTGNMRPSRENQQCVLGKLFGGKALPLRDRHETWKPQYNLINDLSMNLQRTNIHRISEPTRTVLTEHKLRPIA